MFTKNWYPKQAIDYHFGFEAYSSTNCVAYPAFDTSGWSEVANVSFTNPYELLNKYLTVSPNDYINTSTGVYGVAFGNGTVPPTAEDVSLSGTFITGITASNTTRELSRTGDGDDKVITAVFTINNTTDKEITIGEVGLFSYTSGYRHSGGTRLYIPILIERSVLETPITIPAGGVGKVTYTIRRSYPTA